MQTPTDTQLLDFLQAKLDEANYTGRVVMRWSYTGRGWRLHETSAEEGTKDVRQAIARFMEAES